MPDFEHVSTSDPRHLESLHAGSVKNWRCLTCDASASTFGTETPFCDKCQSYMRSDGGISEDKVTEIKRRKTPVSDPNSRKKGRKGRFEDGMVKEIKAVVHPRNGHGDLRLVINMDQNAFMRGLVMAEWHGESFMTSVYEFADAFTPFDPTPTVIQVDSDVPGEAKTITVEKPAKRGKTKVGPITIIGGETKAKFQEAMVTFQLQSHMATFNMRDIAQVIQYAL